MSQLIDRLVNEAYLKGQMDNLRFHGEPIPIEDDSHIHPELRMVMRILKNAGVPPPAVEEMKRIRALEDELAGCTDAVRAKELARQIGRERSVLKLKLEKIAGR